MNADKKRARYRGLSMRLGGEFKALAADSRGEGVSLGVVFELFGFWIPLEFAAQLPGEVCQMADGGGAMADFHVG